jgi:hypothetical protein
MTVVAADTFAGRTIADTASASGWGTASDGNTWALISGFAGGTGTLGVASGEGRHTNGANGTPWRVALGSATSGDWDVKVRFILTNTSDRIGMFARSTDSTHFLLMRYNGAGVWQMLDQPGTGTVTTDISASIALTPTVSVAYWLRFRVVGTTAKVKVWQDGTSEPASFASSTTVSSQTGKAGLYVLTQSTNTENVDSFTADNLLVSSGAVNTGAAAGGLLGTGTAIKSSGATTTGGAVGGLRGTATAIKSSAAAAMGADSGGMLGTATAIKPSGATDLGGAVGGLRGTGTSVKPSGAVVTGGAVGGLLGTGAVQGQASATMGGAVGGMLATATVIKPGSATVGGAVGGLLGTAQVAGASTIGHASGTDAALGSASSADRALGTSSATDAALGVAVGSVGT